MSRREFPPVIRYVAARYFAGWQVSWALVDEEWTRSYIASSHQGLSGNGDFLDTEGGSVRYRLRDHGEGQVSLKRLLACAVAAVTAEEAAELIAARKAFEGVPEGPRLHQLRGALETRERAIWEQVQARLRAEVPEVGPWEQLPLFADA